MGVIEDIEKIRSDSSTRPTGTASSDVVPVTETNYPFFHLNLDEAVRSAEEAASQGEK